jgi:hypothetical protein
MAELVQLHLSPIFHDFGKRVEGLRDGILADARTVMRRELSTSIHQRFYDTGAGLQSFVDEFITEGQKKLYRLFPTAFYMIFGEYGTGRRGAASGQPAPRGYHYGPKPGMTARRFSRIAVGLARPQIDRLASEKARRFAANATVS